VRDACGLDMYVRDVRGTIIQQQSESDFIVLYLQSRIIAVLMCFSTISIAHVPIGFGVVPM
jgi:hypothetical protein